MNYFLISFDLLAFSLSGNKGLCGVPSLPECPLFWENGRLSSRGKIAIGLSCFLVFCLIVLLVYIYIRKRRNDYDFGLPSELMCKYDVRVSFNFLKSLVISYSTPTAYFVLVSWGQVLISFIGF